MDKTIYGQSKVMGFDPKVINLVISIKANLSSNSTELANWNWAWQNEGFIVPE